ncbi:SRPBCC family protein [Arthrobacter sp. BE255]|uniref:SRPBCC family protein n=1 Tax=Arthrobacter sp. BE255 TaxID=2817721 RepID=UPI00285F1CA9|nr:SRPBCC family protein [Arthrobacter sp. BE255]MDR7158147.1 carbon monoxide dehydrogenase subunit G [Arthrobacter sp. BE255]
MAHAENEITIDRSAAEVYAFLADGLNNTKWRPGVKDIALASGAAGAEGAVYSQTLTGPRGRPIQGDYRITTADPGKTLAFQVIAGPARPEGSYRLTEDNGRTTVHFTLDLKPAGLMKVLDGLITKTMQSEVAQLSSLKSAVEAG